MPWPHEMVTELEAFYGQYSAGREWETHRNVGEKQSDEVYCSISVDAAMGFVKSSDASDLSLERRAQFEKAFLKAFLLTMDPLRS